MIKNALAALLLPVLSAVPVRAQAPDPLAAAQVGAKAAVEEHRLREAARRAGEALESSAAAQPEGASPSAVSRAALAALARERASSRALSSDEPYASAERLYKELAGRADYAQFAPELSAAVAEELREIAEQAKDEAELRAMLSERLRLPPPDTAAAVAKGFFPEDLTLAQFRKLGPIRIFLAKHRWRRPASYRPAAVDDVLAGRVHAQIGVEVEGVVTKVEGATFDRDWCFDIGELHLEITPEWRLTHRGIYKPAVGDRVRVRGWTYYDVFHEKERLFERRPAPPKRDDNMWEIHPVQDVRLLRPAAAGALASRPAGS